MDLDWKQLITWVLVILGWLIVSRQNDLREFRKETRARLDALAKMVGETVDMSISFYLKLPGADGQQDLKMKIAHSLAHIGRICTSLVDRQEDHPVITKVVALRQAITLSDFDSDQRPAYKFGDARLNEIVDSSKSLISTLENGYSQRFDSPKGL